MRKIISRNKANPTGTHLQGYINAGYHQLVKAFGFPIEGGYKTDAEWVIEFSGGEIGTIYNWKNGRNYCGEYGTDAEFIKEWNVGGRTKRVVSMIREAIASSY